MNQLVSTILVILVSITAITLVMVEAIPIIENAKDVDALKDTENFFGFLDNAVNEVLREGHGSKRVISFRNKIPFEIRSETNTIEAEILSDHELFQYFSRQQEDDLMKISGSDVSCFEDGNLTMKNNFITVNLRKVNGSLNTSNILLNITYEPTGQVLEFEESMVFLENETTSIGIGYSEIMRTGSGLPFCRTKVHVESSLSYDIVYTLFAYSDFLIIEVR